MGKGAQRDAWIRGIACLWYFAGDVSRRLGAALTSLQLRDGPEHGCNAHELRRLHLCWSRL